ncbi:hypothetical protein SFC07_03945 [Corynebacterium callunae]|uniref:hypothetical protein n=1 Tax=Corynebacterium callunae TaxID=1721 RepID=UPI003982493A
MDGIELEVDAALEVLRNLIGETTQQHSTHRDTQPRLDPSATGRGFASQGRNLSDTLNALHLGVEKRLNALALSSEAAAVQVQELFDADTHFSAGVEGVDRQ